MRIIPDDLAKRLNTSTSPVREALLILQNEGLLVSQPRRGYYVTEIKIEDIEEIYPIRAALMALAIKEVFKNELEKIFFITVHDYIGKMEKCAKKMDYNGYFQLNVKLHNFFLDNGSNKRLKILLDQLGKQVLRFRFFCISRPGHMQASMARHKKLLMSLDNRDIALASQIMEEIICRALEVLRKFLAEKSSHDFPDNVVPF